MRSAQIVTRNLDNRTLLWSTQQSLDSKSPMHTHLSFAGWPDLSRSLRRPGCSATTKTQTAFVISLHTRVARLQLPLGGDFLDARTERPPVVFLAKRGSQIPDLEPASQPSHFCS